MKLSKYKTIDILVFTILAVVFELLCYYVSTNINDFKIIFLSYSIVLSLICVFRWGLIGSVVVVVGGIANCIISTEAKLSHYMAYSVGSLIGVVLVALLFQYLIGREKLKKYPILLFVYLVIDYITVVFFRCLIVSLFDINNFKDVLVGSLRNQLVMQSMCLVISIVILAIANRKNGDMVVEMKSYIKRVQDYQKLGGLKEIKESPKFNQDKPLTEPDEMDEAYILDGGQLSNKELKELEEMMYLDVDEQQDPMDILTSISKNEKGGG